MASLRNHSIGFTSRTAGIICISIRTHTYSQRQEMHFNNRSSFSYFCHWHKVNFNSSFNFLIQSLLFPYTLKKNQNLCPGFFFLLDVIVLYITITLGKQLLLLLHCFSFLSSAADKGRDAEKLSLIFDIHATIHFAHIC